MEENHDKNSKKEQELHFNEFMDKINASSSKCNVQKNKSEFNSSNVTPNYLTQLLKDQQTLIMMPALFLHVERLLEDEILRSRAVLYQSNSAHDIHNLPEPSGTPTMLKEKIYIPVNQYPENASLSAAKNLKFHYRYNYVFYDNYNFVGRILGPRGMTAKQLEQETGCKIMVRGKGSIRDKKMESINRGKANWEHLNDDLHVLITVEDTNNRADVKMQCAIREINKLLIPAVSS
ncbi:KH domain-containing protein [Intoshia linei]|uniref:KH domain-containing protein n=1 Tax=Intoshia linei TaxID=1819745 RepID=A0A177B197_9BILA|nr:KH domain-containing protein [Intoshia linei]